MSNPMSELKPNPSMHNLWQVLLKDLEKTTTEDSMQVTQVAAMSIWWDVNLQFKVQTHHHAAHGYQA